MSAYTEDFLVEQPAIQLMQHELGWDVVNCYDEWSGGVSNQGRDGKREVVEILNVGFWILNGRGRRPTVPRQKSALSLAEATVVHGNIGVHGVREHLNIVNKMLAERS